MTDTMIGVDLAKRVFQLHGATVTGHVMFRKKLTREQFLRFMADHPACTVVFKPAAAPATARARWQSSAMTPGSLRRNTSSRS